MKQTLSILVICIVTGCWLPKATSTKKTTKETYTFDYAPKATAKPGSATMVIASLRPAYAQTFSFGSNELFRNFQTALGSDIEELIISKGFSMKGPFQSYDEMVFDDKKRVDIAMLIEIAPQFAAAEGGWKEHVNIFNRQITYTYEGTVSLVGKINLSGVEPLTNEKLWSKSVLIPNVENIKIATTASYSYKLPDRQLMDDPAVYNALGKALQSQYGSIMEKIAAHVNVEEFNSLKPQIKELKSKKGF